MKKWLITLFFTLIAILVAVTFFSPIKYSPLIIKDSPSPPLPPPFNTILIAEESSDWRPYMITDKSAEDELSGASVELLRKILKVKGFNPKFERMPWKRCLRCVEIGTHQILNNASSNSDRVKKYLRSQAVYQVRHVLFYRKDRFPDGIKLEVPSDLNNFKLGGVRGYNFEPLMIDSEKIHLVSNPSALIGILQNDRCDMIIGYLEIWQAAEKAGEMDLNGLGFTDPAWFEPLTFYFWVSRNYPAAAALLQNINDGLTEFEARGIKKKIFNKYGL